MSACSAKQTLLIMFLLVLQNEHHSLCSAKRASIYYVLLRQAEFEPSTSPLPSKTTGSLLRRLLRSTGAPYVTLHSKLDEEKSKYAGLAQESCFGSA
jgi:hypothetical protein